MGDRACGDDDDVDERGFGGSSLSSERYRERSCDCLDMAGGS